jgi:catechol 2,3-dioxygenase
MVQTGPTGEEKLDASTRLGYVHLAISNMARSLDFYQSNLGFQLHRREGDTAYLGAGGVDLLALTEVPGAGHPGRTTGLYHFAILVPSHRELGRSLRRIAETHTPVQGFADHLVSEAIYLPDPDGNGIEIYRDRPREEWQYGPDGTIKMATDPLDVEGVLAEAANDSVPWPGLHRDTVLGHMHLHVRNLSEAEAFYCDVVGFDLIIGGWHQASFLSAGGYHHHLGINTWAGAGAPPPPEDAVGLRYFLIVVPGEGNLDALRKRLERAGVAYEQRDYGLYLRDPSQNGVLVGVSP